MAKSNTTCPEYTALRKCYEDVIGLVSSDPGSLCDTLFSKGRIPNHVKTYIRSDSLLADDKARKLIDCVIDQIKLDPNVFHEFVEALKSPHYSMLKKKLTDCYQGESSSSSSLFSSIQHKQPFLSEIPECNLGDTVYTNAHDRGQTNTDTSFACPYCNKCSLERYLSNEGCPEATGETQLFPYLNTQGLSEVDKVVLRETLISETKKLRKLFASTDTSIAENLQVDVTILKNYVLDLVGDSEQNENETELKKATSIPEIILALHPYKSFLNYEIIESIVDRFGSSQDHAVMQKYVEAFNEFCRRSAFELPNNAFPKITNKRKETILSVKLTRRGHASLSDIVSVRQNMATILKVKKWDLQICSIEEGCLCVRFLVPAAVMSKTFPLSPDKKSALRNVKIYIGEKQIPPISGPEEEVASQSLKHLTIPQSLGSLEDSEFGNSSLLGAYEGEDIQVFGADVNQCPQSLLLAACLGGHTEAAQSLIEKRADVNQCDEFGQTPLLAACERGHIEIAKLLIDMGADMDKCDQVGRSPLLVSCAKGHTETAQLLIEKGADVNKHDEYGRSPLLLTIVGVQTETAQLLVDKGADVNKRDEYGDSPLLVACESGQFETAWSLINKRADVNKCNKLGHSPLFVACERGHFEIAQLLIDKNADMDKNDQETGQTPLLAAIERDHTKTAQLLIDEGADVNKCDGLELSPLLAACERGQTSTAELLIDKGADMNKCDKLPMGYSPLHVAIERGHTETAQLLIDKGADVDKCDMFGRSPLDIMIGAVGKDNGREEDVERMIEINKLMDLLIKKGAKISLPTEDEHTVCTKTTYL